MAVRTGAGLALFTNMFSHQTELDDYVPGPLAVDTALYQQKMSRSNICPFQAGAVKK